MGRGGNAAMADVNEREERDGTEEEESGSKSEELGEAGKRALDAERKRARAAEKELKELRSKVKEAEDKDKSELERLQERAAEAEKRAERAENQSARYEVAAAKGLSLAQARRLVGSTKEELEADADEMRAELGLDKEEEEQGNEGNDRPRENLRSGEANEDDEEPDAGAIASEILKSSI